MNTILFVIFSLLVGDEKKTDVPAIVAAKGNEAKFVTADLKPYWVEMVVRLNRDGTNKTMTYPVWGIQYKIELDPPTECVCLVEGNPQTVKSGDFLDLKGKENYRGDFNLIIKGEANQEVKISRFCPNRFEESDLKKGKFTKPFDVLPEYRSPLTFGSTLAIEIPGGFRYSVRHKSGKPVEINRFDHIELPRDYVGPPDGMKLLGFGQVVIPGNCSHDVLSKGEALEPTIITVTTPESGVGEKVLLVTLEPIQGFRPPPPPVITPTTIPATTPTGTPSVTKKD